MRPSDAILLLQDFTRRHFVVDIRETDAYQEFMAEHTTTDKVHHISEMHVTTDVCLDSMTVVPHVPPGNTVMVGAGKLQWFEEVIELTSPMESPVLPAYSTLDCDPYIADTTRWSLLCIRVDVATGNYVLFWVHARPGMGYPNIPYNGVPLALVSTRPGIVTLTKEDIVNWRCIRPGYAPSAKYIYPPVQEQTELYDYADPIEGAVALVMEEGVFYYYQNGAWRRNDVPRFSNTSFYVDISAATNRVDLPWPISNATELTVFRDGQFMLYEKDYHVFTGQTPYILFTYNLLPGQRIVVVRNPFFAQAYSETVTLNETQDYDLYVDGDVGNDNWDGSLINPYKTLQRALDVIPTFSNHTYRIHAQNLRASDIVTSDDGLTVCYGYAHGKRVRQLQLIIADSFDWDENTMEHLVYLNGVNYVLFRGGTVNYKILMTNCNTAFHGTTFGSGSRLIVEGGTVFMENCAALDAGYGVTFQNACIVQAKQCTFHTANIQNHGYIYMNGGRVEELYMYNDGEAVMTQVMLNGTVHCEDSLLSLSRCYCMGSGDFSGGSLMASDINIQFRSTDTHNRFFYGHHGASFTLSEINIPGLHISAIKMSHNCTLYMKGGSITGCFEHAIALDHSCTAYLESAEYSNNMQSAVYGRYHCSIEFKNTTGAGNLRYACECTDISRANFNTAWTWGNMGQYYELLPGADTVLADRDNDTVPGTLMEKISVGQGLKKEIVPRGAGFDGEYQIQIGIDTDSLIGTGGTYGQALLNINPKTTVYQHLTKIESSGANSIITLPVTWPGTSYINSVTRRVFSPATQVKNVMITPGSREWFVEEDKWNGTEMTSDGITLVDFPSAGYVPNVPHFFFSDYEGYGALTAYGISNLSSFYVDADVPAECTLRVAFSVNGSAFWRTWNAATMTWDILPGESTLIQMQSAPLHTTVNSWTSVAWDALRQMNGIYITVCFLLTTTSTARTPKVRSYQWSYVEDGFLEDITHTFTRHYYSNRAVFTYDGSLGDIDPPVYFAVMPATHRSQ